MLVNMNKKNHIYKSGGFTLMETMIAMAIFISVSVALYQGFGNTLKLMKVIKLKEIATNLANEQFEIARNLPYASVGTVNGIPSGVFLQNQTMVRGEQTFNVGITIRNVDDPFDGTLGGSPGDLSPADMKMMEISVSCVTCTNFAPVSLTTKIAPKNLETASTNGALIVRVFDASGEPVSGATVNIVNNLLVPNINITDVTGIDGNLTIVDAPPSVSGYQITVSKNGYSTERTYPVGGGANPNPSKPDVTVVIQQISQMSFAIDAVSTVPVSTVDSQCSPTAGFNFNVKGTKLIGTNPDTIKYSQDFTSDSNGVVSLNNLEWDTYNIVGIDSTYDIIGTNPLLSLGVPPNTTQNMQITTAVKNGRRLLVIVRDQSTGLPVTDAEVTLDNGGSYTSSKITDEGFLTQTDWAGGSGQATMTNIDMYLASDGNIDVSGNPGEISLSQTAGSYVANGELTSSTFDTGAPSNFKQILWSSTVQPVQTGQNSVRFQIATNNDETTWNFVGPDGTSNTYFTTADQNIGAGHNGDRYLRYKIFLSTANNNYTPSISDISFTYASSCIPPGQVSFAGLASGNYTLTVTRSGYQDDSRVVSISSNWQSEEVTIAQ